MTRGATNYKSWGGVERGAKIFLIGEGGRDRERERERERESERASEREREREDKEGYGGVREGERETGEKSESEYV